MDKPIRLDTIPRSCTTYPINSKQTHASLSHAYDIAQDELPKFSRPRMPLPKSTRIPHIGIILTAINSGRGWHSQFFFFIGTRGRALPAKMCPTNHSPSKRSKQSGVSARNHCFVCFSEQPEKTLGIINRCKSTSSGNGE